MFVLLESSHAGFIEHLQAQLSSAGIDCHVLAMGRAADNEQHFAIRLPLYSQMSRARHLLYRDRLFALRIDPVFKPEWQALREAPKQQVLQWLTSPLALRISALAVLILLFGSLAEMLWR
ncbi:hypothetical protein DBR00_02960 [Pseudomonas sp. HMWF032]|uniref:hypothetical protein n=1 Tax=unclassified Pseudomonas TaxID=196821 RepID=UPI000D3D2DCF|nr:MULTISPECIES: hypothetical protein [unclassified Pseudomonas]PTS84775.1 hypothetical protein DBR00_02960 [Pseudomonas sp. HMWF032]PTT80957.1 hypothetical protein DBR41_18420 [Pseudomonas sp. HMWF010]WAC46218.1 hypothetical protein OU997_08685 [Pseudomonas sp. SL4(2022)]